MISVVEGRAGPVAVSRLGFSRPVAVSRLGFSHDRFGFLPKAQGKKEE